jgi:NDP-sugar pyrophosphorylase family protein
MKKKISITVEKSYLKGLDSYIDGINIRNRSQAIEYLISKGLSRNRTAVILASKIDSFRILSNVKGVPMIIHTLRLLQSYSFKKLFIIGEKKILSRIFEVIGTGQDYLLKVEYVEDSNPKGSFASLALLKNKINSSFLAIPADNFFSTDIDSFWSFHTRSGKSMTLAITSSLNPTRLGVVDMQGGSVVGFKQKSKTSDNYLVWTGIMICEPEVLYYDFTSVEKELIPKLISTHTLGGFVFTGNWKNVHSKDDVKELNR